MIGIYELSRLLLHTHLQEKTIFLNKAFILLGEYIVYIFFGPFSNIILGYITKYKFPASDLKAHSVPHLS